MCGKVQQFRKKCLDTNIGYRWMLGSSGRDARNSPIIFPQVVNSQSIREIPACTAVPILAERRQMISAAGLDSFGDIDGAKKGGLHPCPVHQLLFRFNQFEDDAPGGENEPCLRGRESCLLHPHRHGVRGYNRDRTTSSVMNFKVCSRSLQTLNGGNRLLDSPSNRAFVTSAVSD